MHPIAIASRLVRQLEFLSVESPVGPEIPNDIVVRLNTADMDESLDRDKLSRELENVITETAAQRGWRLVGPVTILISTSRDIPRGILEADGIMSAEPMPPWAQLIADDGSAILEISLNRTMIGRGLDNDIRVANQEISRHHVVIYRQDGTTMVRDLDSSNGTYLNGVRLAERAAPVAAGDSVLLGDLAFTYRPIFLHACPVLQHHQTSLPCPDVPVPVAGRPSDPQSRRFEPWRSH